MKGTRMNTQHVRQTNDDRDTGRIEAFSDGVIAVAITLLILDVHVPNVKTGLLQALLNQWPTYLGYVASFLVITIFWANHHNMFRHIQQVDYALLLINSLFLMCIAFIPLPPHCSRSISRARAQQSSIRPHRLWCDSPAEWDPV